MRVLLIDAYGDADPARSTASVTADVLVANGCVVDHHPIHQQGFGTAMTPDELRAYRSPDPLVTPETRDAATALGRANALVFCYPATLFGVPPALKNWHERVLVPGVGFRLDHKRRMRPGMTQIRRLGAVATTPHDRSEIRRARDLGRRTIMRTMRMNCRLSCRRTFVSLPSGFDDAAASETIAAAFRQWR